MTRPSKDPLEELISDDLARTRPLKHYDLPTVLEVDLDELATSLQLRLETLFSSIKFSDCYLPSIDDDEDEYGFKYTYNIKDDIASMLDFAMGIMYNRLREIFLDYHPLGMDSWMPMELECPVCNKLEFPAYLSSVLTSIGPFRLQDGAQDTLIIYATSSSLMNNYGRRNLPEFNKDNYFHLSTALKSANVPMSPIDISAPINPSGKYFPTITFYHSRHLAWTLYGTVHPNHYEQEDIAGALLIVNPKTGKGPFEDISMTLGYCDDVNVVKAVAASRPELKGNEQKDDNGGRPVGGLYRVNHYGIEVGNGEEKKGIYILGRGLDRVFCCVLANNISERESLDVLRYRLFGPAR